MKKFQFFAWIRECGELLGMTDRESAALILDRSWFFAFDDGLTPQEAVEEYREKCLGEERKNPPN